MQEGTEAMIQALAAQSVSKAQVNYAEAVAFYEAALKRRPDRYAWTGRGFALLKLGNYEEAIASYDRALAIREDETSWCQRGHALCQLGRYSEALMSYSQALRVEPDFDAAFYGKACVYALQGNVDRAIQHLQQAIALSPQEYRVLAKTDLRLQSIRRDPRFHRLLQNIT